VAYQANTTHFRLGWDVASPESPLTGLLLQVGLACRAPLAGHEWDIDFVAQPAQARTIMGGPDDWEAVTKSGTQWAAEVSLSNYCLPFTSPATLPATLPATPLVATLCHRTLAGTSACVCAPLPLLVDATPPRVERVWVGAGAAPAGGRPHQQLWYSATGTEVPVFRTLPEAPPLRPLPPIPGGAPLYVRLFGLRRTFWPQTYHPHRHLHPHHHQQQGPPSCAIWAHRPP
jgi:hypothetical protein